MKHTTEDLIRTAQRFYPLDTWDENPAYDASIEQQRLRAAIGDAKRFDDQWRTVLDRLATRFTDCRIEDRTHLHLASSKDTCYYGRLLLPVQTNEVQHPVVGLASILVPYYFLFSRTILPEGKTDPPIRYRPTTAEEPYVRGFASEIESAFPGYEHMPPEVGLTVVPQVIAHNQVFGTATLYDCLFTDFRW